eukprot:COSAG01_NODE_19037_length_1035_cov_1.014957_2_plen_76_part_01
MGLRAPTGYLSPTDFDKLVAGACVLLPWQDPKKGDTSHFVKWWGMDWANNPCSGTKPSMATALPGATGAGAATTKQ